MPLIRGRTVVVMMAVKCRTAASQLNRLLFSTISSLSLSQAEPANLFQNFSKQRHLIKLKVILKVNRFKTDW
jgi:hypothetical protein